MKNEKFREAVQRIKYLGFEKQARALSECRIVEKPWYMPWKHLSTTLNGTIYLSKEWPKWDLASHLAHEATHLLQQKDLGMTSFLAAYAQKAGRFRLELEAHGVEYLLACREGVPKALSQNAILYTLEKNYYFGDWFDAEKKKEVVEYLRGLT